MAKYLGPKCRLCRRERKKLFLKGERCYTLKCPIEKKGAVPPGPHGYRSGLKPSGYGEQLREKQKAKRIYGVLERQFKNYFQKASRAKKNTGEALLQLLESRLDNLAYRLHLTPSRSVARQLITHGHVLVDGQKISLPSFQVKPGQVISLSDKALKIDQIKKHLKGADAKLPEWLSRKAAVGKFNHLPKRDEIETDIDEGLIVEFYSR